MRHTLLRLLTGAALLMPLVAAAQTPHPPGDCAGAYFLCDASRTVRIGQVPDAGLLPAELPSTRCADWPFPETNSAWFKWEIAQAGSLAFTLLPLRAGDDLDFVLFRLDAGLDDCGTRTETRCMYSGARPSGAKGDELPCTGATGLADHAEDQGERIGCQTGADNFLAPLRVAAGERYALFVHNFRNTDGFLLEFSGDCAFKPLGAACAGGLTNDDSPIGGDARWRCSLPFPNPASQAVQVNLYATEAATGTLQLIDVKGALLKTQPCTVQTGDNRLALGLDGLPSGLYFIRVLVGPAAYLLRFEKAGK